MLFAIFVVYHLRKISNTNPKNVTDFYQRFQTYKFVFAIFCIVPRLMPEASRNPFRVIPRSICLKRFLNEIPMLFISFLISF